MGGSDNSLARGPRIVARLRTKAWSSDQLRNAPTKLKLPSPVVTSKILSASSFACAVPNFSTVARKFGAERNFASTCGNNLSRISRNDKESRRQ